MYLKPKYRYEKLTSNEAGRSVGKSPSPLARAGFAPYAIRRATISFSLRPAAIWSGVFPGNRRRGEIERLLHNIKFRTVVLWDS